eukprot:377902-Karenia_brevis.AAC.1
MQRHTQRLLSLLLSVDTCQSAYATRQGGREIASAGRSADRRRWVGSASVSHPVRCNSAQTLRKRQMAGGQNASTGQIRSHK